MGKTVLVDLDFGGFQIWGQESYVRFMDIFQQKSNPSYWPLIVSDERLAELRQGVQIDDFIKSAVSAFNKSKILAFQKGDDLVRGLFNDHDLVTQTMISKLPVQSWASRKCFDGMRECGEIVAVMAKKRCVGWKVSPQ